MKKYRKIGKDVNGKDLYEIVEDFSASRRREVTLEELEQRKAYLEKLLAEVNKEIEELKKL